MDKKSFIYFIGLVKWMYPRKGTLVRTFFMNHKIYTAPISFFIRVYSYVLATDDVSIFNEYFQVNNLMRFEPDMFVFFDSNFSKFAF